MMSPLASFGMTLNALYGGVKLHKVGDGSMGQVKLLAHRVMASDMSNRVVVTLTSTHT